MSNKTFQVFSYLSYWLNAVDEHSLHSPFFFDFYTRVVKGKSPSHPAAEKLRVKLLNDKRTIDIDDPGSKKSGRRNIRDIAQTSLSRSQYSALYSRIISKYECKNVLELGTSLGINALYLGSDPAVKVTTIEGSKAISEISQLTFDFAKAKNIRLIEEFIDDSLPKLLETARKIDFVFIDANHTYEATVGYFNLLLKAIHHKSVVVIDDIHYSSEMERAWNEIKANPLVHSSADLYRCGILFFDPSLNKQHVILQF